MRFGQGRLVLSIVTTNQKKKQLRTLVETRFIGWLSSKALSHYLPQATLGPLAQSSVCHVGKQHKAKSLTEQNRTTCAIFESTSIKVCSVAVDLVFALSPLHGGELVFLALRYVVECQGYRLFHILILGYGKRWAKAPRSQGKKLSFKGGCFIISYISRQQEFSRKFFRGGFLQWMGGWPFVETVLCT